MVWAALLEDTYSAPTFKALKQQQQQGQQIRFRPHKQHVLRSYHLPNEGSFGVCQDALRQPGTLANVVKSSRPYNGANTRTHTRVAKKMNEPLGMENVACRSVRGKHAEVNTITERDP